jgi:hypothetical protein
MGLPTRSALLRCVVVRWAHISGMSLRKRDMRRRRVAVPLDLPHLPVRHRSMPGGHDVHRYTAQHCIFRRRDAA